MRNEVAAAIQAAGGSAKLTVYPDKGHGICYLVYNDGKFYDWLVAQKRLTRDSPKNSPTITDGYQ